MNSERIESCSTRISKALAIREMRQSELCRRTGIPKCAMSQYISGAYEPKQDRIFSIAEALDVSEVWLMGYDVPMRRTVKTTLGDNILRLRKANGLTQEELAKKMGYKSKTTINKIELGINHIPQSKIQRFAEVLGTTPGNLMGWETTTEKQDLTDNEKLILKLFNKVPEDKQCLVIEIFRAVLKMKE